jgi:hypothetical protein
MLIVFVHQLYLGCLSKGQDDMNAKGMIFMVDTIAGDLGMPFYQSLVTK